MIPVSLYMYNIMMELNKSEDNIDVSCDFFKKISILLNITFFKEVKIIALAQMCSDLLLINEAKNWLKSLIKLSTFDILRKHYSVSFLQKTKLFDDILLFKLIDYL